jgi:Protein of unknown function (DUF2934)
METVRMNGAGSAQPGLPRHFVFGTRVDPRSFMAKERKPSSAPPASPDEADRFDLGDRDRIAMRAYELYLARGGADGGDFDDWLAAERELAGPNGRGSRGDAGE